MRTPVAPPRMQSSYHFDTATIKFPKWELDSAGVANQVTESVTWFQMTAQIPTLGIWEWAIKSYGILALPRMGSATLLNKSGTDKELDKLCQVPKREVCAAVLRWRYPFCRQALLQYLASARIGKNCAPQQAQVYFPRSTRFLRLFRRFSILWPQVWKLQYFRFRVWV